MDEKLCSNWVGFAASIPGSGHIRRGLPCQDASAVTSAPRPALIVCDGRGSASLSQDGAQAAVRAFLTQVAVFEPMLAEILDSETASSDRWEAFARILYRTLMQVKLDLSAERKTPEKEFDFTVACAIVGTNGIGCFQVGDGAIVLRQGGATVTAFLPDKGEFANQTVFLRPGGENAHKYHADIFPASINTGIAITSDGPEHLMFKLAEMKPGRIFEKMMDDLHDGNLCQQDLMDYLTRRDWEKDPRGGDDRSIAILAPLVYPDSNREASEFPSDGGETAPCDAEDATAIAGEEDLEETCVSETIGTSSIQEGRSVSNTAGACIRRSASRHAMSLLLGALLVLASCLYIRERAAVTRLRVDLVRELASLRREIALRNTNLPQHVNEKTVEVAPTFPVKMVLQDEAESRVPEVAPLEEGNEPIAAEDNTDVEASQKGDNSVSPEEESEFVHKPQENAGR